MPDHQSGVKSSLFFADVLLSNPELDFKQIYRSGGVVKTPEATEWPGCRFVWTLNESWRTGQNKEDICKLSPMQRSCSALLLYLTPVKETASFRANCSILPWPTCLTFQLLCGKLDAGRCKSGSLLLSVPHAKLVQLVKLKGWFRTNSEKATVQKQGIKPIQTRTGPFLLLTTVLRYATSSQAFAKKLEAGHQCS